MRKDWLRACTFAALVWQAPAFADVVIEFRAVKVNDVALLGGGTPTPSVNPGDKVEVELILLPGFGAELPDGVRAEQVIIAGRVGVTSGGNDRVLPLGWDAPLDLIRCDVQSDCPVGFTCSAGQCVGGNHFPSAGIFFDEARPDYVFFDAGNPLTFTATTTLDYTIGGLDQESQGVLDNGSEFYLGTYILEVGDFACGTFTFTGVTQGIGGVSELVSPDGLDRVIPSFIPLEMNTGACGPLPTDPLICAIDARYPHPPTSTTPSFAGNSFTLEFAQSPVGLVTADFVAFTNPPAFPLPGITSVQVSQLKATVTLSTSFSQLRWTCIRHLDTNRIFCRRNLPGDSDQSQLVQIADVEALIEELRPPAEPVPLSLPACDIDRSGACSPLDLLASVNLLGGSGLFSPGFLGASFTTACPGLPRP